MTANVPQASLDWAFGYSAGFGAVLAARRMADIGVEVEGVPECVVVERDYRDGYAAGADAALAELQKNG